MKKAFTLAEVLITLGIIGVVVALTLPVIVQNHIKETTVKKIQQNFSLFEQINKIGLIDNETFYDWDASVDRGVIAENFVKEFLIPNTKIMKNCGFDRNGGCFPKKIYYLNGEELANSTNNISQYLVLGNGTCIYLNAQTASPEGGNLIAAVMDTNGFSGPNRVGRDIFEFKIGKDGIVTYKNAFNQSREYYLSQGRWYNCNKKAKYAGFSCINVIIQDGFKIGKGYPW